MSLCDTTGIYTAAPNWEDWASQVQKLPVSGLFKSCMLFTALFEK